MLVVDDNEHNRLIFEEQLDWWQIRSVVTVGADDAERAVAAALAAGDPFDAVLLDMSMPDRDGLDLALALRQNPAYADLRLLMLTSATVPNAEELEAVGIAECLTKPALSAELRGALLRHLAGVEPPPVPEPAAPTEAGSARRILVVEDNPVNQLVAVGLLEALGYVATTAGDGVDALAILRTEEFDAVLMDVQMPRLDGYATTRAIRAGETDGVRLPVIAMTAAAVEGERERCLAAGMDDFLTKPVDPRSLATMISHWIGDDAPRTHQTRRAPRSVPPVDAHDRDDDVTSMLALDRLDELRDLDPGNTTYLDRAIGNFMRNTPETLVAIRAAAADRDAAELKHLSHKLAGGALNLGVNRAGRTAQEIELVADSGSTDGTDELIERLAQDLEDGRAALQAYQATYSTGAERTAAAD